MNYAQDYVGCHNGLENVEGVFVAENYNISSNPLAWKLPLLLLTPKQTNLRLFTAAHEYIPLSCYKYGTNAMLVLDINYHSN